MKQVAAGLLIIAILAFVLLLADRHLRVSQYIEPFDGSMDAQCGVDMAPCDFPLQCVNGYCKPTNPPSMSKSSGLPVLP